RISFRRAFYDVPVETGLFSIITPVWNGSPPKFLKELAESLYEQNKEGNCEWLLLDNGCSNKPIVSYLSYLSSLHWVKVIRAEENIGIARGLRLCLEHASGRYVLPVDADDLLYRDALKIITWHLVNARYPPLLYTDEDKIIRTTLYQPYLKSGW